MRRSLPQKNNNEEKVYSTGTFKGRVVGPAAAHSNLSTQLLVKDPPLSRWATRQGRTYEFDVPRETKMAEDVTAEICHLW
jgi:hypothetical protein